MTASLPPNPYHDQAWVIGEPEIGDGTWIGAFTVIDGSGGLRICFRRFCSTTTHPTKG